MFAYNICTCAHVEHVRMARNKFTVMYTVMHFAQTMILSDCTSNLKRVSTLRNYGARARVAWMLFNRVLSAVSRVLSAVSMAITLILITPCVHHIVHIHSRQRTCALSQCVSVHACAQSSTTTLLVYPYRLH